MKVSVVVPTYNREKLLKETMDGILGQTHKDIELIIVDNCSKDNTEGMVKAYNDPRIRYFRNANNGVIAVNRNLGVRSATGKYLAFCDDDDVWLPAKLEKEIAVMENDEAVGLVCTNAIDFNEKGDFGNRIKRGVTQKDFTFERLVFVNYIICASAFTRKSVIDDVGVFSEIPGLMAGEDYDLWLRIASKYKVVYLPEPLMKYRTHLGAFRKSSFDKIELERKIYKKLFEEKVMDAKLYEKRIKKLDRSVGVEKVKHKILGRGSKG